MFVHLANFQNKNADIYAHGLMFSVPLSQKTHASLIVTDK